MSHPGENADVQQTQEHGRGGEEYSTTHKEVVMRQR